MRNTRGRFDPLIVERRRCFAASPLSRSLRVEGSLRGGEVIGGMRLCDEEQSVISYVDVLGWLWMGIHETRGYYTIRFVF